MSLGQLLYQILGAVITL